MPELPMPRHKPQIIRPPCLPVRSRYAELHVTSNFSFLRGASHPEELIQRAAAVGSYAIAITDINTLAGVVRAYTAAKQLAMACLVGCHLQIKIPRPSPAAPALLSLLVYPTSQKSYAGLCRMLTVGKRRTTKGQCELELEDILEFNAELLAIAVPPPLPDAEFAASLQWLKDVFDDDRLSLAISRCYGPYDSYRGDFLTKLSDQLAIPPVATNDVLYHLPQRQALGDILTCIRLGTTRAQAGFALVANAERFIKEPAEMYRLFADIPHAINRTAEIASRAAGFSLDTLQYQYPSEVCPAGKTMMQYLMELTHQGAMQRYPQGVPTDVHQRLEHEFTLIRELNYAGYFLTVYDIVSFARSRHILCQGRGAAANSAVCYCLGITAVDPTRIDLLLERFISRQRDEPPDIDIDFEHHRRPEVIEYLYQKYGADRVALTAEVITYRRRSALRDVGKALGFSLDGVDRLAKSTDWWEKGVIHPAQLREIGFDPADPTIQELAFLVAEIQGFPRHLSQHVGGFIITAGPLCHCVPIENTAMEGRTIIEWDKDDIDAMGILKVDILALGMLTAIRRCLDLVNAASLAAGQSGNLQLHHIPPEDPAVYDMLCRADSIGVFQVESRAQMSMLPRLKPRCYYDLVIEVAIVRPGPIVGDMVHPYLRRRNRQEPVEYPDPKIRRVLERTLGVPLFQEQAMALAMAAAGFTPDQADQLRRAMAAWKRKGHLIEQFEKKITAGMTANGYTLEYAQAVFNQIRGFGEYGFPESHAASFALLVYVSAWLKCHHPAAFCAALLNSQPMGFYQPAQLVRDACAHGVQVLPVDIHFSHWDCTLEYPAAALRLGMCMVRNLPQADAQKIVQSLHAHHHFSTPVALWRGTPGIRRSSLLALARADAFGSMGLTRPAAIWAIQDIRDDHTPLFDQAADFGYQPPPNLPNIPLSQMVVQDYASTSLSLKAHPISFLRPELMKRQITSATNLKDEARSPHGARVGVAGLVLVRQRPATAGGITFITLEDETGTVNLIVKPRVYDQYRQALRGAVALIVHGRIERRESVVHVLVQRAVNLSSLKTKLEIGTQSRNFH